MKLSSVFLFIDYLLQSYVFILFQAFTRINLEITSVFYSDLAAKTFYSDFAAIILIQTLLLFLFRPRYYSLTR